MSEDSHSAVRAVVASRQPFEGVMMVLVRIQAHTAAAELLFLFEWWPQYRVYRAVPVVQHHGEWRYAYINLPPYWHRGLKRVLARRYGVRHMHHVNQQDNTARVMSLLGLQSGSASPPTR